MAAQADSELSCLAKDSGAPPRERSGVLSLVNQGEGQGHLTSHCLVDFIINVHFLSLWEAARDSRWRSVFY